jgi:hypothetical protein
VESGNWAMETMRKIRTLLIAQVVNGYDRDPTFVLEKAERRIVRSESRACKYLGS